MTAHRISRRVLAVLIPSLLSATAAGCAAPPERALYEDAPNGMFLLDSGWSTRSDPGDVGLKRAWQRPRTTGFRRVSVPHAFSARRLTRRSFNGAVQWYRATFDRPEAPDATGWKLRFESVNVSATVWLNGVRLGRHRGAYLPFELPARSIRAGTNHLVVRVDSRGSRNDLPPANRPRGWWNFGGILREVYLREVRAFDLSDLQVVATPGEPASVTVSAYVRNTGRTAVPLDMKLTATGPGGFTYEKTEPEGSIAPGDLHRVQATFSIPQPALWTPDAPNLYQLAVKLPGGQVTRAHFGVRSWSVGRDGRILLNGRPLPLRGASFHEQVRGRGSALTPADRQEIVAELKRLGANVARQHYPPHPALLEAFDREGIAFWEQIPLWRVRDEQLRRRSFRAAALSTLRRAIVRDRNHPSVLAWSASNETLRGGRGELAYLRAARALVRRADPTRLLAADKSLRPLSDIPAAYRLVDAIGLNEYVGWYGGRTTELPGDLRSLHRRFPRQALVVTEFGAEANRSGPATIKGTYAFQRRFLERHLRIFDSTPYLSGALVWALRDFAARPGWTGGNPRPRPPVLFKGLFSEAGTAKPALAAVRERFDRALGR